MIIIERHYATQNGGGRMSVTRKAFQDNDVEGVQNFIDNGWYDAHYEYVKL